MNPAQVLVLAQLLLQYGPSVAQKISNAFHKPETVNLDDWNKIFEEASNVTALTIAQLRSIKTVG